MSPNTPPSPVGSGQLSGGVAQPAMAANSIAAPSHAAARFGRLSTPRAVTKKKPQMTPGTSAATDESPRNCMAMSEKTAPG
ncbi:hypothetical protein [Mesorhizobium marinum]|uniref:hypothetical protein n=1 Tax=Mesorhizobium marinum TaxID=3228790 RepID=UPI003F5B5689